MKLNILKLGQGKPLVFFHGWGFDHRIWLELSQKLLNRYEVFLIDLPGFGQSSLMDWQDFKSILLNNLPAQFALAGWSMGGLFATRLALEEPDRVSRLFNICTTPCFLKKPAWPGIETKALNNFFNYLNSNPQKAVAEFIAMQLNTKNYQYTYQFLPSPQALAAGLHMLASWDLREALKNYLKPVCWLFGKLDSIVPNAVMTAMQQQYPDFDYVLFPKAAHIPFLSQQQEFLTVLTEFIQ